MARIVNYFNFPRRIFRVNTVTCGAHEVMATASLGHLVLGTWNSYYTTKKNIIGKEMCS